METIKIKNKNENWCLRMRACTLKDLQHTGTGDIPDLVVEFLSIQNNQVF